MFEFCLLVEAIKFHNDLLLHSPHYNPTQPKPQTPKFDFYMFINQVHHHFFILIIAEVKDLVCNSCSGPPLDTCEEEENIVIGNSSYEAVQQFCYLGDMLSAGGGAEASSVTPTMCPWKKFRELLPILSSRTFSLKKKGSFYQACVRPVLLYGSETWPVKEEDLVRLHRTEMSMLRWMSHPHLRTGFLQRIYSPNLICCLLEGLFTVTGYIGSAMS